jgi:hypothetical protein
MFRRSLKELRGREEEEGGVDFQAGLAFFLADNPLPPSLNRQDGDSGGADPVMFIPHPTFFHPGSEFVPSRIPDPSFFLPGCRIRIFSIPDPNFSIPATGSASKNLSILNPKNCFLALGNMTRFVHPGSRIPILIFYPSRIPDPRVKKAPDPGSGFATLDGDM